MTDEIFDSGTEEHEFIPYQPKSRERVKARIMTDEKQELIEKLREIFYKNADQYQHLETGLRSNLGEVKKRVINATADLIIEEKAKSFREGQNDGALTFQLDIGMKKQEFLRYFDVAKRRMITQSVWEELIKCRRVFNEIFGDKNERKE